MTKQADRPQIFGFDVENLVGEINKALNNKDLAGDLIKAFDNGNLVDEVFKTLHRFVVPDPTASYKPEYVPATPSPEGKMSAGDFIRDMIGAALNNTARKFKDLPQQISTGKIEESFQKLWNKTLENGNEHLQIFFVKPSHDRHQIQKSPIFMGDDVSAQTQVQFTDDNPIVFYVHTHPSQHFPNQGNPGLHFSDTDFHCFLRPMAGVVAVVISREERIMAVKTKETLEMLNTLSESEVRRKIDKAFRMGSFGGEVENYQQLMMGVQKICSEFKMGLYIAGSNNKMSYVRVADRSG